MGRPILRWHTFDLWDPTGLVYSVAYVMNVVSALTDRKSETGLPLVLGAKDSSLPVVSTLLFIRNLLVTSIDVVS